MRKNKTKPTTIEIEHILAGDGEGRGCKRVRITLAATKQIIDWDRVRGGYQLRGEDYVARTLTIGGLIFETGYMLGWNKAQRPRPQLIDGKPETVYD